MVNIGQNFMNWVVENAGPIAMGVLIIAGLYCLAKRKFLELAGLIAGAIVAFLLIYNPIGVKDALVDLGNRMIESGGTAGLWLFQLHLADIGSMSPFLW